jgi:large subunit ribosomal protein L4e
VTVFGVDGAKTGTASLPGVFSAPIRADLVQIVHTALAKNKRQAYAVNTQAGMQHSAESWGTGRAVARIPRISGSGTSRAGQAAFGNMVRQGRMFAPTRIWRKWHRKVSVNQRRYAVASALAATAVPALVQARGHAISAVQEVPLVVSGLSGLAKTKQAVAALSAVGAFEDVQKAKDSRKVRAGKGKMRNRRYTQRRGPLEVFADGEEGAQAGFRNLPGVECCHVDRLNLLQLAPGGHMGRFVVWSEAAFNKLPALFGAPGEASAEKTGFVLPRTSVSNADIARIINSAEVQAALNPKKVGSQHVLRKKNPLKNLSAMVKLNPYAMRNRRMELTGVKTAKKSGKRAAGGAKFYTAMKDDEYTFGQ